MPGPHRRPSRLAALVLLTAGAAACNAGDGGDGARSAASPAAGATTAATVPPPALGAATGTTAAPGALPELPVPRTEVAGATWGGALVVAGGLTAEGAASGLVHVLDEEAGRWEPAPALPVPLHHAGMAVVWDRLWVVGGYAMGPGQTWVPQAAVRSLGAGERVWRDEAPLPGGPRGALGLAATGGFLVAAGGESGGTPLGRTEIYDPEERAWRAGPELAQPREHLAVAAVGERVYAVAGRAAGAGNFVAVESLDPARERTWRPEPPVNHARGGIGAAAVGDRLCVAGGEEDAGTIASVECLDGDGWTVVARLARPRHGLAVMALGGHLHVVSGGERPGLFVSGAHEALDL